MNRSLRLPLLALAAAIALATTLVPPARAAVDCSSAQGIGVERACAKAREGAAELRRFVARTQGIYVLSVYDFDVTPVAVAADDAGRTLGNAAAATVASAK